MSLTDEDRARRLAGKRRNERVKLLATTINASAIALIGTAIVLPAVPNWRVPLTTEPLILMLVAFGLHLMAQGVYRFMRSED